MWYDSFYVDFCTGLLFDFNKIVTAAFMIAFLFYNPYYNLISLLLLNFLRFFQLPV